MSKVKVAASISCGICGDCGDAVIELKDGNGRVFATAHPNWQNDTQFENWLNKWRDTYQRSKLFAGLGEAANHHRH